MGRFAFRLPDIGEGIAQAEIVAWHVKVGDRIEEDDRLADMMTDKATVEMESPVAGTVRELAGEVGDLVAIGSTLVVIETEEEGDNTAGSSPAPKAESPRKNTAETASEAAVEPAELPEPQRRAPVPPPPAPMPVPVRQQRQDKRATRAKVLASPAVRERADALGIDLGDVRPAADGRVRHADLDAFLAYNAQGGYHPAGTRGIDQQVRVIGLRRRIADAMSASKRHIPHFSYVEECDVTSLETLRAQLNDHRGSRARLTLLPFLVTAICRAVPDFPMINARYDDEAGVVTRFGAVHLGIATQTPAGLMVPVLRDAQDRNLWQLGSEIARIAEAAREGSARSEDLSGSTLTITSLGPLGGIATTPVINRPEVAIIGPNRIVERPMYVTDASGAERIEKRKLMNLSISCDHRVVDGWDAASFVQSVRRLIEAPALLLAG